MHGEYKAVGQCRLGFLGRPLGHLTFSLLVLIGDHIYIYIYIYIYRFLGAKLGLEAYGV